MDPGLEGLGQYLELAPGQQLKPANKSQEQIVCKDQDTRCTGNASGRAGTRVPDDKRGACQSEPAGPGGRKRWSLAAGSLVESGMGSFNTEAARGGGAGLKETSSKERRGGRCL